MKTNSTENSVPATENLKLEDLVAKPKKYEQHPFGKCWQPFDEAAFEELVADVDRRGLDKEIVLYQGMVLDGWHRYLACLAAKVEPKFVEFEGTELEAAELVHASGIRRHVSADQRYASFVMLCEACPAFKEKYEQLKAQGEQQRKAGTPLVTGSQRVDVVKAKADAAGVSKATAKKVEMVKRENPGAVADIAAGRTTANKELKKLKKTTKQSTSKGASAKDERPTISEAIEVLSRGLSKVEEADKISTKKNVLYFELNGHRIKVNCKIM
jgi:hypothetical protein